MESNQLRGHVGAALHLVYFGASGVSQTKQRGTHSIGRSGSLTETFPMPQSQTSSLLFDVVKNHRNAHRYRRNLPATFLSFKHQSACAQFLLVLLELASPPLCCCHVVWSFLSLFHTWVSGTQWG